ncbi:MAG TPA: protease modulator HflC [Mesotoga infera]|jgi:membrane protease subunit HflC|uniref:Protein HflC n=1 Tax=Mesotoga infera TaxID=1236046 RepID=A0A7Z7LCU6_9BACT|nr:protease modulator HflC [Mesotoga infera]MBP8660102.1 protease modulator HflC [Mesotoga sp.]NLI05913.1 protease modulator HflC [Thermotogaceae bacterium]SSC11673.1 Protein HflC [Mesotoga infera]HNR79052.1 protease modulator HflC [Mesotoga infera]HNS66076.1 protease modulator HflC [Mesotoga infera]
MKYKWIIPIAVVAILILVLLPSFFFTIDETEQAVVLRFGEIRNSITEPGLYLKTPFVDTVRKFDKRLQIYDVDAERIYSRDKKTILMDTYALWKIVDPQKFIETMKSEQIALTRIDDVVYSNVRNAFGKLDFDDIISGQRKDVLDEITRLSARDMADFGLEIVAVRVKRADLPDENRNAVFNRMKSERIQEASLIRAEGDREARKLMAEADKQAQILIAEAQKEADIIIGTGDASALAIYAEAYNQDPSFYEFMKRLEVYEGTLIDGKYILGPSMEFIDKLLRGE